MRQFILCLLCLCSPLLYAQEKESSFILCENSLEMLDWDLDFISKANQSIEISGCFCGGNVFQRVLDAVENKLQEVPTLQVHLLCSPATMDYGDQEHLERLKAAYPENFHYQMTASVMVVLPDYSSIENHIKCMVIDQHYFSLGGTNLDDNLCTDGSYPPEYQSRDRNLAASQLASGARDMDVVGSGELASELRSLFFKLYAMWEHYVAKGNVFISDPEHFKDNAHDFPVDTGLKPFLPRFETNAFKATTSQYSLILSGPMQETNAITRKYEQLICKAKEEIMLCNLYFCPQGKILEKLKERVKAGVHVELITNGLLGSSPSVNSLFVWATRINYVPLFYGEDYTFFEAFSCINAPVKNTQIYEYDVDDVLYHKKVAVIDRRFFVIGSYNLGRKSHISDYELALVIDHRKLANTALRYLKKDRQLSKQVTPKEAREWYFNPLIIYMAGTQNQFHGLI